MTYFSSKESNVKALKDLYDAIGEEAEEGVGMRKRSFLQGPFHYAVSITLLVTIFSIIAPDKMYFPIAGILIMIISDTLASMVGKKYGKIKIKFSWTSERSLEGSITFFSTAFLLCLFCFSFYGIINPLTQQPLSVEQVLLYSLITSALGTVIELLSPSTWDDLSVPIATTLIIFLLSLI
jgi:dolichol kinase